MLLCVSVHNFNCTFYCITLTAGILHNFSCMCVLLHNFSCMCTAYRGCTAELLLVLTRAIVVIAIGGGTGGSRGHGPPNFQLTGALLL